MISVWQLPLRAIFYLFYDVDIVLLVAHEWNESKYIYPLKRCYLLEKKRLHRFKPQLLNFRNFRPGQLFNSCLGFDLNLSLSSQHHETAKTVDMTIKQTQVWFQLLSNSFILNFCAGCFRNLKMTMTFECLECQFKTQQ